MKYDFTSIIDRRGKDALAVDNIGRRFWGTEPEAPREGFDPIPMWVADMNFPTVPRDSKSDHPAGPAPALWVLRPPGRILREDHPLADQAQRLPGPEAGIYRL